MIDFAKLRLPLIMGIVNASEDSFSENGSSVAIDAPQRALQLLDSGADILDIGGESTRPGAKEIGIQQEIDRILPTIQKVRESHSKAILSVDTRKAEVAKIALENGANIINDVSMLRYSPNMAEIVAQYGASLILNHSRGIPQNMREKEFCNYGDDVIATVVEELNNAKEQALNAGVCESNIILDPGLGFAKNAEQDWEIVKGIDRLHELGPICVGFSRKSFLGDLLSQKEPTLRLGGTIAVAYYLTNLNVEILRVHDVRQVCDAIKVYNKLR